MLKLKLTNICVAFCAKPFKVSAHGLLLPVRLMHKLNKQVLIGELPLHNIESDYLQFKKEIDTRAILWSN